MGASDDSGAKVNDESRAIEAAKEPVTLWHRATYRWAAISAVMALLLLVYTQHPYYLGNQFAPFRSYYPVAFVIWLVLGLFYVKATLQKFSGTRYTVRDGGLHLLMLAKTFELRPFTGVQKILSGVLAAAAALWGIWKLRHDVVGGEFTSAKDFVHRAPALYAPWVVAALVVVVAVLLFKSVRPRRFWSIARNPRVRTTLLGILVKAFYTPLMIGFFSGHANNLAEGWLRHKNLAGLKFVVPKTGNPLEQGLAWFGQLWPRLPDLVPSFGDFGGLFSPGSWTRGDVNWGLGMAYDAVFFVDCGWALIGYSLESRWLGNKTRSVEPTALGWAAALSCYPPYNNVLGTYLPLNNGTPHFGENVLLALRAATVLLFFIYATATVAFGFKFSNLTNRGTVSRGPYRFVRHPAYLTKCTAWWLEHLPTITLQKAFFLSLLCGVYALRAWTEERHLSRDPDYRAYKKKVPWIFIPGVF